MSSPPGPIPTEAAPAVDTPFAGLSPDLILDAVDAAGFRTTGGLLELNSYENRVYQVELEDGSFVVPKFYRPGRWTDAQIAEEHAFTAELREHELPVVAPLARDGQTLFTHQTFRYAVFPRQGGHAPNLENPDNLQVLARTLARMHAIGQTHPFETRPSLSVDRLGVDSRAYVLEHQFV
ncbi:MAG: serine/threonine protein kinase, partial [Gammaproteobacteria bacterium]